MMRKLMTTAVAVAALGGGLAATTAAAPAASASGTPKVVAFNWWHGSQRASHYFPSVRPEVLGGRFTKFPVRDIVWHQWKLNGGAFGVGLLRHHGVCHPCLAAVILSHAKLRPSGHGHYFNWETVNPMGDTSSTIRLHWSFRAKSWVRR